MYAGPGCIFVGKIAKVYLIEKHFLLFFANVYKNKVLEKKKASNAFSFCTCVI